MVILGTQASDVICLVILEPLFKYAGQGSINKVRFPNLPKVLEVDLFNRFGQQPLNLSYLTVARKR
jgi:hypothetical protein